MEQSEGKFSAWTGFLGCSLLSVLIYSCFGFDGWLWRDDAIYTYIGQQFANGTPPYYGTFDHKTPLAGMLAGIFVAVGRFFQPESILSIRAGFCLLSALAGGSIFLLGRQLWRNAYAGWWAALSLAGFWSFGREAVSGPRAKTPFVLFEILFFYFATVRRWFWAGFMGALCTWVWQPGVVFAVASVLLAFFLSERSARLKNAGLAFAGVLVPTVILTGYFVWAGAFQGLLEGSTLFKLHYLYREPATFWSHFTNPIFTLYRGYGSMFFPSVIGTGWLLYHGHTLFWNRKRDPLNGEGWQRWAPVFCVLPFPVTWTLLDFQGAADLYPFLPFFAIGVAGLAVEFLRGLTERRRLSPAWVQTACLGLFTIALIFQYSASSESSFLDQKKSLQPLVEKYGDELRIASIGSPEAMVILGKTNPNRYLFVIDGIDQKIEAEEAGGIAGWLRGMDQAGVEFIAYGTTNGPHANIIQNWLKTYYKKERFGYFDIYVRNKTPLPDLLGDDDASGE